MTTSPAERTAKRLADVSSVFVLLALGVSFLSAVGDRFGFLGNLRTVARSLGRLLAFHRVRRQTQLVHAIGDSSSSGVGFHFC
jgi:hypothetical protein